ncbi:MAG: hypothetical protein ACHQ9S_15075 [Candidatus Binatia bacterium]
MKKGALKKMDSLRQVHIKIDGKPVVAWEPKDRALRAALGRWTDPKALLGRIYAVQHPEEMETQEGPGRQWQATWRGRFTSPQRTKSRKAA